MGWGKFGAQMFSLVHEEDKEAQDRWSEEFSDIARITQPSGICPKKKKVIFLRQVYKNQRVWAILMW